MRSLVALLLVLVVACEATPTVMPSASPTASAPIEAAREIWGYSGTLLLPRDASVYENVLDAAIPLRDGGWLVLRQNASTRSIPRIGFGGQLFRRPIATLLRLDSGGVELAREHGSEPFALRELRVFEDLGIVIGYGAQVLNGSIHAFDLATLDGLWTLYDRDPVPCVKIADHCWTYRRSSAPTDTSALTERDARTYRVLRTFPHLGMDGVDMPPGIYPATNTVVWNEPGGAAPTGRARVGRLELDRPPAAWATRVDDACWATPVGAAHLYLQFGDCADFTLATFELFEVATGRTVRIWPGSASPFIDGNTGFLSWPDALVDLRDGSRGPEIPGTILGFDERRGIAAARLSNGGAAIYRRGTAVPRPVAVDVREIARLTCSGFEFPQVAPPRDSDGRCPAVEAHAGPRRILVTRGRMRASEELTITGVTADIATRQLTIRVDPRGDQLVVPVEGVARILELPESIRGVWLVRLDAGTTRAVQTFVVNFP